MKGQSRLQCQNVDTQLITRKKIGQISYFFVQYTIPQKGVVDSCQSLNNNKKKDKWRVQPIIFFIQEMNNDRHVCRKKIVTGFTFCF